ncbi:radical SAM protein [Niastella caeni]|uniref:Radical SAM protein n=1 Tax=Niastella caeni TaxID=2569763 RepID=A0A4S8HYV6_9BACT|nr:radical SAM protein [Niastella caeni]THU40983.1 radical SAM protein [Niastella caeni]
MQTITVDKTITTITAGAGYNLKNKVSNGAPGMVKRLLINWAIKCNIFWLAILWLRRPGTIWKVYRKMIKTRNAIWDGNMTKIYKVDGRYHYSLYAPGWPSKAYNNVIKRELLRHTHPDLSAEKPSFIFLAITRKCPMRCEHCFEWDNLNQKESFTKEDLLQTVKLYQQQEVLQIHFSGGEPMVRIKDLLDIIAFTSKKSECWVLTSGFNMTAQNARLLKQAGCRGVVVSIDHYIPELHNLFRGHAHSFSMAVQAVDVAKRAGLVTALSVCGTRQFITQGSLLPYMDFARQLGVQFVQVLEPVQIGHYENQQVLLEETHIQQLEQLFLQVNHAPEYRKYPTLLYHGFHQRRIGCFSGSRSVYIDSAGDVHACPFCHTRSFNIIDHIRSGQHALPQKENQCPRFGRIA